MNRIRADLAWRVAAAARIVAVFLRSRFRTPPFARRDNVSHDEHDRGPDPKSVHTGVLITLGLTTSLQTTASASSSQTAACYILDVHTVTHFHILDVRTVAQCGASKQNDAENEHDPLN
jgi:hypothetical protein